MNHPIVLSENTILKGGLIWTDPCDDPAYVYFLIKSDVIVYVGQSISIDDRFKNHLRSTKDLNRFSYCIVSYGEINEVEALYVHTYSPCLNRVMPTNNTVNVSKKRLLELIELELPEPDCKLKDGKLCYYSLSKSTDIINMIRGHHND